VRRPAAAGPRDVAAVPAWRRAAAFAPRGSRAGPPGGGAGGGRSVGRARAGLDAGADADAADAAARPAGGVPRRRALARRPRRLALRRGLPGGDAHRARALQRRAARAIGPRLGERRGSSIQHVVLRHPGALLQRRGVRRPAAGRPQHVPVRRRPDRVAALVLLLARRRLLHDASRVGDARALRAVLRDRAAHQALAARRGPRQPWRRARAAAHARQVGPAAHRPERQLPKRPAAGGRHAAGEPLLAAARRQLWVAQGGGAAWVPRGRVQRAGATPATRGPACPTHGARMGQRQQRTASARRLAAAAARSTPSPPSCALHAPSMRPPQTSAAACPRTGAACRSCRT
jgi:hypothetical protein